MGKMLHVGLRGQCTHSADLIVINETNNLENSCSVPLQLEANAWCQVAAEKRFLPGL